MFVDCNGSHRGQAQRVLHLVSRTEEREREGGGINKGDFPATILSTCKSGWVF